MVGNLKFSFPDASQGASLEAGLSKDSSQACNALSCTPRTKSGMHQAFSKHMKNEQMSAVYLGNLPM